MTEDGSGIKKVEAPALVVNPSAKAPEPPKVGDRNTAPTTTAEQDIITAGQRHINRVWEYMQALIAAMVIGSTLFVAVILSLMVAKADATDKQIISAAIAFLLLSNLSSLIIGFYYGRTNHQRVAGVEKGDIGR